jgi:antitoxin (DNA-binding transcriptional repressor) of toxin-antitoxin stability system
MREPRVDGTYATPDDLPISALLPELIENARQGRVTYLSEHGEPVAAVVPLEVAEAGLVALRRRGDR